MPRFSTALLLAALLSTAAAASAADTYPIKIHRPAKVGDAADVHIATESSKKLTITTGTAEPVHQDESIKGDIVGRLDVKHVDPRGEPDELALTVKSFTDADGKPLADPGAVLTIKLAETTVDITSPTGAPVADAAKDILTTIYHPLQANDASNDDDVFGSATPRKVGDAWPINTAAAAKSLQQSKLTLDPADISGEVTLASVNKIPAGEVLHLTASFNAKNVKPEVPPGATLGECTFTARFEGDLPADTTAMMLKSAMTMDAHITLNAADTKVTADIHGAKTESYTPLKK